MNKIALLKEKTSLVTSSIPYSRTHELKTFNHPSTLCKVKRDDELGFGVSGSKLRKYTSLIPYMLRNNYKEAVVIGSAYSNHVLSMSQFLIENRIKPILFLLGDSSQLRQGNLLLTSLLVPESDCHWVSRKDWTNVETLAASYVQQSSSRSLLIPEGACMNEALPGSLTLPLDILRNEKEEGHSFDHVFIDAGTGLTAIATILAFAWISKKTLLHILLLADTELDFLTKLKQFQHHFESFLGDRLEESLMRFKLYLPSKVRSFGSVNRAIINHIKFLAQKEGFFTDPIYSAKLFMEANKIIENQSLEGNVLLLHSGGALTLMGFQQQLR